MKHLLTLILTVISLISLAQSGGENTIVISADKAGYNSGYSVSEDNDFASKKYVDDMVTSTGSIKEECDAATTSNKTLSDTIIIDGVQTHAGNRILVKDQTNPVNNGIYTVVKGGAWTRSLDFDTWGEVYRSSVFILGGTVNAGMTYTSVTDTTGTVGVDTIQFTTSYQINISGLEIDSIYSSGGVVSVSQGGNTYSTDPLYTLGTLTEGITGLEFSNSTRQVIGGSTTLNLSSGYLIPTTALKTTWDAGYNNSPSAISIRDTLISSLSYKYIKLTRTGAPPLYSNTFAVSAGGAGVNLTGSPGLYLLNNYLYHSDNSLITATPATGDYVGFWDISSEATYKQSKTTVEGLGASMIANHGGVNWSGGLTLDYLNLSGGTPELSDIVSFWDISGVTPKSATITTLFNLIPTMSNSTRGMAQISSTSGLYISGTTTLKQSDYYLPLDEASLLGDTDYIGFCNSLGNQQYKTTLLALKNYIGGGGDMLKSTYDTNTNNAVDNSESLGGVAANQYVTLDDSQSLTNKTLTTPIISSTASGSTAGRLGYNGGVLSFGNGSSQKTVVTLDDSQALTNKSVNGVTLVNNGAGTSFLANDGIYKTVSGNASYWTQYSADEIYYPGNISVGQSTITSEVALSITTTSDDNYGLHIWATNQIGALISAESHNQAVYIENSSDGESLYVLNNGTGEGIVIDANSNTGLSCYTANSLSYSAEITGGKGLIASQYSLSGFQTAPASATATGSKGEIRFTADYIYVCTATNTWKRTALTTW